MIMKRRLLQVVIAMALTGGALFGGQAIAQAVGGRAPTTTSTGTMTPPSLPDQVGVLGPKGVVEGTVPRADLVGPPPNVTPGSTIPVADTPGAVVVVNGDAGYPVSKDGNLVGYWVPPAGFMTIAAAESAGAVPASGAGPVGSGS